MIKAASLNDIKWLNKEIKNIDSNYIFSEKTFAEPFFNCIIYFHQDNPVAFLKYSFIYDRIEIDYVYVKLEYRKMNIATMLVDYVIKEGIENSSINITLEVKVDNTLAIKLYEKMGFVQIELKKGYYNGIDGILMIKELK